MKWLCEGGGTVGPAALGGIAAFGCWPGSATGAYRTEVAMMVSNLFDKFDQKSRPDT